MAISQERLVEASRAYLRGESLACSSCALPLKVSFERGAEGATGGTFRVWCPPCKQTADVAHQSVRLIDPRRWTSAELHQFAVGMAQNALPSCPIDRAMLRASRQRQVGTTRHAMIACDLCGNQEPVVY